MDIILATVKDAYDIADILSETWSAAYMDIIPSETIAERNMSRYSNIKKTLVADNDSYYIVRDKGKAVATFCIGPSLDIDTDRYTFEVMVIYVRPRYWRQGIGSLIMADVIEKAKRLRMKTIKVWVLALNTNAIEFYKKTGFIFDGQTKTMNYGKNLELLRMEKRVG